VNRTWSEFTAYGTPTVPSTAPNNKLRQRACSTFRGTETDAASPPKSDNRSHLGPIREQNQPPAPLESTPIPPIRSRRRQRPPQPQNPPKSTNPTSIKSLLPIAAPPKSRPVQPIARRKRSLSGQETADQTDSPPLNRTHPRTHATGLSGVWGSEEAALPSSRPARSVGRVPPPPPCVGARTKGWGFGWSLLLLLREHATAPLWGNEDLGVIEWGCVCFFEGKGSGSLIYRGSREEYLIRCAVGPAVSEALFFHMLVATRFFFLRSLAWTRTGNWWAMCFSCLEVDEPTFRKCGAEKETMRCTPCTPLRSRPDFATLFFF
jgi:hypothetical protein